MAQCGMSTYFNMIRNGNFQLIIRLTGTMKGQLFCLWSRRKGNFRNLTGTRFWRSMRTDAIFPPIGKSQSSPGLLCIQILYPSANHSSVPVTGTCAFADSRRKAYEVNAEFTNPSHRRNCKTIGPLAQDMKILMWMQVLLDLRGRRALVLVLQAARVKDTRIG
jgi:hypothetical protein